MMEHMDALRRLLLLEPRGYPCQNVDYILPPTDPEAAFSFVIGEQNKIYPMMSGARAYRRICNMHNMHMHMHCLLARARVAPLDDGPRCTAYHCHSSQVITPSALSLPSSRLGWFPWRSR